MLACSVVEVVVGDVQHVLMRAYQSIQVVKTDELADGEFGGEWL